MTLDITLVTNPVRAIRDYTTWADDPSPYYRIDVDSVKGALLYGDSVLLRSYMVDLMMFNEADLSRLWAFPLHRLRTMLALSWYPPEVAEEYGVDLSAVPTHEEAQHWLDRHYHLGQQLGDQEGSRKEALASVFGLLEEFSNQWPQADEQMRVVAEAAAEWRSQPRHSELQPAVDAGLLGVAGWLDEPGYEGLWPDEQEHVNLAADAILCAAESVDRMTCFGPGASVALGHTDTGQADDVKVAGALLAHLPGFSSATVAEVVDIRSELSVPLVRFRSAVVALRKDVASLDGQDFDAHIRDHYLEVVAPAIEEIAESVRANRYLEELADTVTAPATWAKTAGAMTLALGPMPPIADVATAAIGIAGPFVEASRKRVVARRQIKKSDYYLLHRFHGKG